MKKIITILVFLIIKLNAQNLVNNPSFENIISCPSSSSQFSLVTNWLNPTQAGTPDLFSICGTGGQSLPSGPGNFQQPKDGSSIIAIWLYTPASSNFREYIQTQLTTPLINSNLYYINYYVNLHNGVQYAVNNFGMSITTNQIAATGATNYLLSSSNIIHKFNNPIISDTMNWNQVSGIYQATGGEQYLTFGNFSSDNLTDTLKVCPSCIAPCAYYFIDDVSVENITTPQWQYLDTTIYLGDSVLIGPAITGLNVDWYDMSSTFIKNDPGIYVKPIATTSYQATETFNSVVYNHTVTVTVLMPVKVDEYDKLQNSISIFPNPNNGNVSLQFTDVTKGNVNVTVYDVNGRIVYENKLQVANALTNFTIDVKGGIYFVKIYNVSLDKTLIKKLVVH